MAFSPIRMGSVLLALAVCISLAPGAEGSAEAAADPAAQARELQSDNRSLSQKADSIHADLVKLRAEIAAREERRRAAAAERAEREAQTRALAAAALARFPRRIPAPEVPPAPAPVLLQTAAEAAAAPLAARHGLLLGTRLPVASLGTSAEGRCAIQAHEGYRSLPYTDAAGQLTIGWGHRIGPAEAQRWKRGLSLQEARELFEGDIARAEEAVRAAVTAPLHPREFDALVSLAFNVGAGALRQSTLARRLNAGDYAGAADEFDRWSHARGRWTPGLALRRDREEAMFRRGLAAAEARPASP